MSTPTKPELKVVALVVRETRQCKGWAKGQAEAYGVDLTTPQGRQFYEKARGLWVDQLLRF